MIADKFNIVEAGTSTLSINTMWRTDDQEKCSHDQKGINLKAWLPPSSNHFYSADLQPPSRSKEGYQRVGVFLGSRRKQDFYSTSFWESITSDGIVSVSSIRRSCQCPIHPKGGMPYSELPEISSTGWLHRRPRRARQPVLPSTLLIRIFSSQSVAKLMPAM